MKYAISVALALAVLLGCNTAQRRLAYNSISSVGHGVDLSMKAYMDLVVADKVSRQSLPEVARAYNDFQAAFSLAVQAAQFASNAPASSDLVKSAASFTALINASKGMK